MTLSALASEILTDLETQDRFFNGASLEMLHDWLGNAHQELRDALKELLNARRVYRQSSRFFLAMPTRRSEPLLSPVQRQRVDRLLSEGFTQDEVATRMNVSLGAIKAHRRRTRKIAA